MPVATGTAILAAAAASAAAGAYGANKAANAQKNAATQATDTQRNMFDVTQQKLAPYNTAGSNSVDILNGRIKDLTAPVVMDQAALENTPGYKFNLTQGLKAVQNGASARGLGTSGAALKGAATYATGLADSTYQNQFANAVTNQTNSYNRLLQLAGLGENAAAGVGNAATTTGASIGNNIIGAGNAQGAAYMSGANAAGTAAQSVPTALLTNKLLENGIYGNNNQFAGGASGWTNPDTGFYNA